MVIIMDKIVLVIYAMILYSAVDNLFWSRHLPSRTERNWVRFFCASLILQSFIFGFMQIMWLLDRNYVNIATNPSVMTYGWSIYNWLSGVTLFLFSRMIDVYIKWAWEA